MVMHYGRKENITLNKHKGLWFWFEAVKLDYFNLSFEVQLLMIWNHHQEEIYTPWN